jgi:predicted SAM-dependent methyltransferase
LGRTVIRSRPGWRGWANATTARVGVGIARARAQRRLAALEAGARLHLGCGAHAKRGWVNIDFWLAPPQAPPETGALVVNYDLTRGLPMADDTCSEIYSSHFLEHLDPLAGARLLSECHRVLRPRGRLRTCAPDFGRLARAYVAGDTDYFAPLYDIFGERMGDGVAGSNTIMDAVNNGLYQFGEHRCMYDLEKLQRLLSAIGFTDVRAASFDPTIDGDWDAREHFSIYVDAYK